MKRVFFSLGSNLGDREEHLRRAIHRLSGSGLEIRRISPVYETAPQGYLDQHWFLNLAAEGETGLEPYALLERCREVEHALGRVRLIDQGPRTIDIDIIDYEDCILDNADLQLPHPRYRDRLFVLRPLADIDPNFQDPVTHQSIDDMLEAVKGQPIRRTPFTIPVEPLP